MTPREEMLNRAIEIVCKRSELRGKPEDSFQTIAGLWMSYLFATNKHVVAIDASDVAAMMALMKIARIAADSADEDSWVDLAGYAACGYEAVRRDKDEKD